jgi:hypothetical protein
VHWDAGTAHLLPRFVRLPDGTSLQHVQSRAGAGRLGQGAADGLEGAQLVESPAGVGV